jgi:hypothetical protein
MPGRGPAPGTGTKPAGQRRRRNKTADEKSIALTGTRVGPASKLPRSYLTGEKTKAGKPTRRAFLAETRKWFTELCASPEGTQFSTVDITYLRDLVAPAYDRYLREPTRDMLAELRLQLSQFGATPDAKKRLGWKVHHGGQTVTPPDPSGGRMASVHRLRAVDPRAAAEG